MTEHDELESARTRCGLSVGALWSRYFALGGMSTPMELEAALFGALVPGAHDRDLIVLALNERFAELDLGHPLPYSDE
jgi:hypothetical protein